MVAEGIETEGQRDTSADIGCTFGQGYLFSASMSETEAAAWLVGERHSALGA